MVMNNQVAFILYQKFFFLILFENVLCSDNEPLKIVEISKGKKIFNLIQLKFFIINNIRNLFK